MKTKMKIGLSLLIALAFLIPSGSAINSVGESKAEVTNADVDTGITINNLGAQAPGDVSIQNMIEPVLAGPDGNAIVGGTYPITIGIINEGPGDAEVKAFVDIYHKTEGIDVLMYETSFEDNFDIYNNWIQIDEDCGIIGGFYDSWSWTDARSYCGDYSMKSTMYDVYKGNQDDYLQCTKSFDVSDQDALKIEFIAWVQGDWNLDDAYGWLTPYDFLDFEIGDDSDTWYNPSDAIQWPFLDWQTMSVMLPGSYYFPDTTLDIYNFRWYLDFTNYVEDLGDGWWKITYEAPVSMLSGYYGLNIEDIMFRFSWHTDPEFQYEGAYVDCVKVISVEHMEEKVFQSHSQGPFTVEEGYEEFTFPMEWTVAGTEAKDECYDIKLWIEVIDDLHQSVDDWGEGLDIYVCVTEWFDVEVTCLQIESSFNPGIIIDTCDDPDVIPDTDVSMEFGDDAHIIATIHADGTLPVSNVPVTAAAYKKTWDDIFSTDFEGLNPFNDLYGNAHITQKDAWSGAKSLGFFDETYYEYLPSQTFNYAIGPNVDFYDDQPVYMEFYWKGLTEGTTAGTDYVNPCIIDNHHNTLLGNNGALAMNRLGGYQPDWIGPMQPSCRYQRVDLLRYYTLYRDTYGYLYDGLGNEMHEAGVGFYMTGDGDSINYNAVARSQGIMWSGVFIDDVRVFTEEIAATPVWSETLIVPGPLEPCDEVEVQFEWENLPYSNYLIEVTTNPDGACGNLEDNSEKTQIHVYSDLERAHWKEMETIDYTSLSNGEFGISSSDYDNYFASNADYHRYVADQDSVLQLCIDGEKCLVLPDGDGVMTFDAWYEIEDGWDWFLIEVAECGADTWLDWTPVNFYYADGVTPFYYGNALSGSSIWDGAGTDEWFLTSEGNWIEVHLLEPFGGVCPAGGIEIRLHFVADASYQMRGIKLDNFAIPDVDFEDPCDNFDNWCEALPWSYGSFWTYDSVLDNWCWDAAVAAPYNDGLIWSTEIMDAYQAEFCFNYDNALIAGVVNAEISVDGGVTWLTICRFTPTYRFGTGTYCYDLTPFVGKEVLIRFTAEPDDYVGGTAVYGVFCIDDLLISGKKDLTAPITTITMTGTMTDAGWYSTPVVCKITATDVGAGMGSIFYVLDGVQKEVVGSEATFTVSGNGAHTLTFWGVDKLGNEEVPHHVVPTFRIDAGAPPSVAITAPEPGLYLFGNKLISLSKVFIIGAFTVEATATDAESGVYRVQFLLDGDVIGEDTEAPFSCYCAVKHMGAGTITAIAEDFSGNTASDTLDITYYKFL